MQTKGSASHSGHFHDKSSWGKWFGGSSCYHPCCPGFGFGVANQQGVNPAAAARQRCRSARSPGAWDCKQHVPRWPGLRRFKCFKHAVESPSNVTQKLPGARFGTHGKQSGCCWLESGHDMLHNVVKFGSCNELTTFITLTQVYSVQRFGFWNGCGWCVAGRFFERKPTMHKPVWGIDAPSGQRSCIEMKVFAMHVSQTQDPWFVYAFKHVVKDILRTSLVERSIVVRSSFSSDLCERGSNFPGIQEQLFNRGDYWLFLICNDLSCSHSCKALGPLSLRLLFEIELQQLHICKQIRDCLKPFLGSKDEFGRCLTLHLFFRPWLMPCAWTKQSQSWICGDAKLVMTTSRPGGDGTQGCGEHRWDRTQGVSFLDQCAGRLLTEKSLIQVTCEISKHHKLLQVWNSNLFFNVCGMRSAKNLWFLFCHESSTSHSAWHSAYISSTFSGLGFWTVFSRIMTLFLKMEAVIVLGKSILVRGRAGRIKLFFLTSLRIRKSVVLCLGRDLIILTYSVEPQFRHVSYSVGMCRILLMRYPSITSCFKFGISFFWLNSIGTETRPKQIVSWLQISLSMQVECLFKKKWLLFCHESSAWPSAYISSRSWPMPCASTKPSHIFSSLRTRLVTQEWRSGGWSVSGSGGGRVDGSRHWMEVMGSLWPDLIRDFKIVEAEPFHGLIGSWTLCLSTWFRHCSWTWKGWYFYDVFIAQKTAMCATKRSETPTKHWLCKKGSSPGPIQRSRSYVKASANPLICCYSELKNKWGPKSFFGVCQRVYSPITRMPSGEIW